jgi:hypothetical protein
VSALLRSWFEIGLSEFQSGRVLDDQNMEGRNWLYREIENLKKTKVGIAGVKGVAPGILGSPSSGAMGATMIQGMASLPMWRDSKPPPSANARVQSMLSIVETPPCHWTTRILSDSF